MPHYSGITLKTGLLSVSVSFALCSVGQVLPVTDSIKPGSMITVVAGKQYGDRSNFYQKLWGRHYRKEWTTPVQVPLFSLDTAGGGLTAYEAGGGVQSNTLRLRNAEGKEYVLRSIDKTYGRTLPPIFRNTFVEGIINDQVSSIHPYAAVTIPGMAEAAKVYHTHPQIVYVPRQGRLDTFNNAFGNSLYLFEQRPDDNWEEAPNFGRSEKIISTGDLLQNLTQNAQHQIDQAAYVRARLFDMFIGDWGRHEDQWRWASFPDVGRILYRPIPRDRDQVYTKFEGRLLKFALSAADLGHLETFDYRIGNVSEYNFPARHLDRRMANEPDRSTWMRIAKELQQSLSDSIIEASVRQLPPEVFSISGPEIIAKLKSRRGDLERVANEYYHILAKEVGVVGTEEREHFEINRINDFEVLVAVYTAGTQGERRLLYQRLFRDNETEEVRLFGLGGEDTFSLVGEGNGDITVRIIGGAGQDRIADSVSKKHAGKMHVYDDQLQGVGKGSSVEWHRTKDSIYQYRYDAFRYDKKSFGPSVFYTYEDRFYVGLDYEIQRQKWGKDPFGYSHGIDLRFSLSQGAPSITYKGTFNQVVGRWNLNLYANYDAVRWTNFFGFGNESEEVVDDHDYYRMRTREALVSAGLSRNIGKYMSVSVGPIYQTIKIINDEERYVASTYYNGEKFFNSKHFGGAALEYAFIRFDRPIVPTRGVHFRSYVSHLQSLQQADKAVTRYGGDLYFYLPLFSRLVLACRVGGASLSGEPELYQYNSIGGSQTLRGYRRDRFWGKTAFYNSNELQWLFDVRSRVMNGTAGLIGLYDIGRVWLSGESSDSWHSGVGGGFLIAPFNRAMVSLTYGVSQEGGHFHLRYARPL